MNKNPLLLVCIALAVCSTATALVVNTAEGPIKGYSAFGVNTFRGVPFASPPVGPNRFRRTQPVTPWTDVKDCTAHKSICPQIQVVNKIYLGNEDCLYLDVYAPEVPKQEGLPVVVWFFGGGFVIGDGYEFGYYDGTTLVAKHGYILVAGNYRLGGLGFMALDQLREEDPDSSTGNAALFDQRAVLQWVQRNIHLFGGDKTRVTIMGESAGAMSVMWHMASPGSAGLFHGAIAESGTADASMFFVKLEDVVSFSNDFAAGLKCNATSSNLLECLRVLPASAVMGHVLGDKEPGSGYRPILNPLMPWTPVIDRTDVALPETPLKLFESGSFNKVPLIMGTNENEGTIFTPFMPLIVPNVSLPIDWSDVRKTMFHFFPNNTKVDAIMKEYPAAKYKSAMDGAGYILRDFMFVCSSRRVVRALEANNVPSFLYHFNYTGVPLDPVFGVYHSSELEYVFDEPWPPVINHFSANDTYIANTFGNYWSNHIWSGNPNGANTSAYIEWPSWAKKDMHNLLIDVPVSVESNEIFSQCQFWDDLLY